MFIKVTNSVVDEHDRLVCSDIVGIIFQEVVVLSATDSYVFGRNTNIMSDLEFCSLKFW